MSTTNIKSSYYLLEKMLDGGLPFLRSYLHTKIEYPVIITDALGQISYPDLLSSTNDKKGFFIDIPEFTEDYYYEPYKSCLYYAIQHNTTIGYVIVENLPKERIDTSLIVIKEGELALKYYFSLNSKKEEDPKQSLSSNSFTPIDINIPEQLKLYEPTMDPNKYYFVSVLEVEEVSSDLNWNTLRLNIYSTMQKENTEYVSSIIAPERLITIHGGNPVDNPMDIDPNWPGQENLETTKQTLEEKFNFSFSLGIGKVYPPSDLLKSYQEACIALALSNLVGEKHSIQYFSQLGVFTPIFSLDFKSVRNYCMQILGKVIEHDKQFGTDFVGTLRILLDNACSWTTTASKLYVHVNTVYYRMFKIEKLLNVNFSSYQTRIHLYTAIKTWDVLQKCELIE